MTAVTRFEDIQGWQEARKLVKMVYKLTNSGAFAKDFGLRDQIQRAAVSSTLAPDAHLPWGSARECRCDQHCRGIRL
jgi:23S rRNA-intervening sequence protein